MVLICSGLKYHLNLYCTIVISSFKSIFWLFNYLYIDVLFLIFCIFITLYNLAYKYRKLEKSVDKKLFLAILTAATSELASRQQLLHLPTHTHPDRAVDEKLVLEIIYILYWKITPIQKNKQYYFYFSSLFLQSVAKRIAIKVKLLLTE